MEVSCRRLTSEDAFTVKKRESRHRTLETFILAKRLVRTVRPPLFRTSAGSFTLYVSAFLRQGGPLAYLETRSVRVALAKGSPSRVAGVGGINALTGGVMGFDQKGNIVLRVARGNDQKWTVSEEGFEKPLASFDNENDARTYANDLAKTKAGSKVQTAT